MIDFANDATGHLALLHRPAAETSTELAYDGRGFLRLATETVPNPDAETKASISPPRTQSQLLLRGVPGTPIFADGFEGGDVCEWSTFVGIPDPGCPPDFLTSSVTATYSSEGVLHALEREAAPTARHVFYFAGRPVALRDLTGTTETWRWVTTDHLGTPIAATSTTGALQWSGGFEPFGRDYTTPSAQGAGIFLRLPGQWLDEAWEESSLGAEVYYNVHRWYENQTGKYTRPDPLGAQGDSHPYLYASADPLALIDPTGEKSRLCCTPLVSGGPVAAFRHCFIQTQSGPASGPVEDKTYGLHRVGGKGCTYKDDGFDKSATTDARTQCGEWAGGCEADPCVEAQFKNYPNPSDYQLIRGPNSNSFASTVAQACGLTPPPIAGTAQTPGWGGTGRTAKQKGFKCPEARWNPTGQ